MQFQAIMGHFLQSLALAYVLTRGYPAGLALVGMLAQGCIVTPFLLSYGILDPDPLSP